MTTHIDPRPTTDQFREASKEKFTCPDCGWFCLEVTEDHAHTSCKGELFGKHHPAD